MKNETEQERSRISGLDRTMDLINGLLPEKAETRVSLTMMDFVNGTAYDTQEEKAYIG
jgi:hypothetical protein